MNTQKQLNGKSGVTMAVTAFGKLIASALVVLALLLTKAVQAQTLEVYLDASGFPVSPYFNMSVGGTRNQLAGDTEWCSLRILTKSKFT